MNLINTIKGIVKEEITKDLSPTLEKLLHKMLVKNNQDILCGVTVVHPDNRESLPDAFGNNFKFTSYKVTFIFIGGYGTKYWPVTQAVQQRYDNLVDDAWNIVYNFTGKSVDIFTEKLKKCE